MTQPRPHIDEILTQFFSERLDGKTGLRKRRIERVEAALHDCLETDGERVLVTDDRLILEAEREFHADNAFARTMYADDLLIALCPFVRDPWLADDPVDRRVQLQTTDALAGWILGYGLVDRHEMMCALLELRVQIDTAKNQLKRGSTAGSQSAG